MTGTPPPTAPDPSLGPEWALLELLCTGVAERQPGRLDALLSAPELRWGELLEQALRHQMLPMLALHALRRSERSSVRVPGRVAQHLLDTLEANRHRMSVLRRETARIAQALRERGIAFAATKGITFESTIYRGEGVRVLKDVDFLITPPDRDGASALLAELGYRPGVYNRATRSIVPHPRRQHMRYLLNPDHLPRHARPCTEPGIPSLYVDFANSLTWHGSPYEIPVERALSGREEMPLPDVGASVPRLGPDFQLLFTILHLFREAWLEQWVDLELDVTLAKFGDVIRLVEAHGDALEGGAFASFTEDLGVTDPVAWVLEHTDRALGTDTAARAGLQGRADEDSLFAAHPSHGRQRRWAGTMRERLWAKDRRALFRYLERPDGKRAPA